MNFYQNEDKEYEILKKDPFLSKKFLEDVKKNPETPVKDMWNHIHQKTVNYEETIKKLPYYRLYYGIENSEDLDD